MSDGNPVQAVQEKIDRLNGVEAIAAFLLVVETVAWCYDQEEAANDPVLRHVLDSVNSLLENATQAASEGERPDSAKTMGWISAGGGSKPDIPSPTWEKHGTTQRLFIGTGCFTSCLEVLPDLGPGGYWAYLDGASSGEVYSTIESAKAAAIDMAYRSLTASLSDLHRIMRNQK